MHAIKSFAMATALTGIAAMCLAADPANLPSPTTMPFTIGTIQPAAANENSLPVVSTYEDLLKQPATRVSGWDMRVGVADPGPEMGPVVILYGLANWIGGANAEENRTTYFNKYVGPLGIKVSKLDVNSKEIARSLQERLFNQKQDGVLFWQSLVLPDAGRWRIVLTDSKDIERYESVIQIDATRVSYWQQFARYDSSAKGTLCARSAQLQAILPKLEYVAKAGTWTDKSLWSGSLPGLFPQDSKPDLRVTLEDGNFVLDSGQQSIADWTDTVFLARWWINGKAIEPQRLAFPMQALQQSRQTKPGTHMTFGFALPDDVADLRQGDSIGLQVLYNPGGFEFVPPPAFGGGIMQLMSWRGSQPMLSNRLDFKLTSELLAKRHGPATQP